MARLKHKGYSGSVPTILAGATRLPGSKVCQPFFSFPPLKKKHEPRNSLNDLFLGGGGVLSLAWVELSLFLAKLHFTYNIEFLNGDRLDLHRDSWFETLWSKPELYVRVSPRI